MKSRTGLCTSLGKGAIYAASINQKLNTTSSTEAELVGVSDGMPKITWTRYFMEAQFYNVEDVYVYEDNQSDIILETNSMKSIGKNSRHIKIKYFFVTDRVKDKELKTIYCLTKAMVADFFTKPLQGLLFLTHQNAVLGISEDDMALYRRQYEEYVAQLKDTNTTCRHSVGRSVL